jgi:predicted peptidase
MKRISILCALTGLLLATGCSHFGGKHMYAAGEYENKFSRKISRTVEYRYHLFLPSDYSPGEYYPLLLFLHGAGERGTDLRMVKHHGLDNMLQSMNPFPFIVISPQVPDGEWWDSEALHALIEHAVQQYNIDAERVYVTGLSMGGAGTWDLISRYPDTFAAAIPICGWGNRLMVYRAHNVPVWTFHGDADTVIPPERTVEMVEALEQAGGKVVLTVYPDTGHDSWTRTYRNPEIYRWLLSHKRNL